MRQLFVPAQSLALAALLAGPFVLRAEELSAETLYSHSVPSVLTLRVENKSGERYVGTAFLSVRKDIAVTAWHVIYDAVKVTGKFADGASFDVSGCIDYNETKDIALIKVPGTERSLLTLADVAPSVGAKTYVIGSPKGYEFSIGDGLLSQIQKVDGFDQFQVSCPFSPGNSGGPILNNRGEVIGIATWTRNGAQNVNFATPASEVAHLDPAKTPVPWRQLAKKKTSFSSDTRKRNSPANESAQSAEDLKKVFGKATGKEITVTVSQDGQQEKFTFKVPPDFVK
jgi:S1-C subfamily serine protease